MQGSGHLTKLERTQTRVNLLVYKRGDTCSENLYEKLAPMNVTKIAWFDWLAVFESFWYKFLLQVS